MARSRIIKPAFFRHEGLYDAERETGMPLRVAFAGIWTVADKSGRFEWRPRTLKPDVLPHDDLDFGAVMEALRMRGFLLRYEVGGKVYGCIPSWGTHQTPNQREPASTLPEPPGIGEPASSASHEPSNAAHVPSGIGIGIGNGIGIGREPAATASGLLPETLALLAPSPPFAPLACDSKPPAVEPKHRKPVTEQRGIVGDLARLWAEAYATHETPKPVPTWGGEAARVIALAKSHGEDDVRRAFTRYLACGEDFFAGHPLTKFVASGNFDRFRMEAPRRALSAKGQRTAENAMALMAKRGER